MNEQLFLNAATGNLVINRPDEFVAGLGPDLGISRTYNSLGTWDGDNGDNWQLTTAKPSIKGRRADPRDRPFLSDTLV